MTSEKDERTQEKLDIGLGFRVDEFNRHRREGQAVAVLVEKGINYEIEAHDLNPDMVWSPNMVWNYKGGNDE